MKGKLQDKVIIVTGGSSGIGRVSALGFTREGAKVVIADTDVNGAEETVEIIEGAGGRATYLKVDVSNSHDVEELVKRCVKENGRLDCAFNNAGIEGLTAPTADCTEDNWDRTIDINLKGVWLCMKYQILEMLKRGGGSIVNTSSVAGLVGVENRPAYVASKHGIAGLTKAAAIEYSNRNIRVNAICPGVIRTPLIERLISEDPEFEAVRIARHPIGRLGAPEDVAKTAAWLLSDDASFVTGHIMAVDGGYTAK